MIKRIHIKKSLIIFLFLLGSFFSSVNAEPTQLQNIYISPQKNIVILSSNTKSDNLKINKGVLSEPSRVFFDIEGAILSPSKQEIFLENEAIKNIKIAQFSTEPNIVRMVLFLNKEAQAKDLDLVQYKGNFLLNSKKELPRTSNYWLMTYYDKLANAEEGSFFAFYKEVRLKKEEKPNEEGKTTETKEEIQKPELKETTQTNTEKNIESSKENTLGTIAPTPEISLEIKPKPVLKAKVEPLKLEIKPQVQTQDEIQRIAQEKQPEQNEQSIVEDIQNVPDGFILKSSQPICVNRFFDLKAPKRLVLDINGNLSAKLLNQSKPVNLANGDNVKIALFEEGTSRFVIDNTISNLDYEFIISPDSKSLVVTSNLAKVQDQYNNFFKPSEFTGIQTNKIDDNSSEIIFDFSKPILHSFKKTDETFEISLYNVDKPNDEVLSHLNKTKHFSKVKIFQEDDKESITISIPIKSTYKLQEFLGFDAKRLKITMNDIVYPLKEVEISKDAKVIIDPGHGGKDQGCSQGNILEKNITLDIAKKLDKRLKDNNIQSILTRKDDTYLTLNERTESANSSNATIFISVHVNSCKSQDIKGIETHWYGKSAEGKNLAKLTQNNLVMELNTTDRGTFRSKFYVVHHTKMPAVLVEVGFMSNNQECQLIKSKAYQEEIAKGLEKAILLYLGYDNEEKKAKNEK